MNGCINENELLGRLDKAMERYNEFIPKQIKEDIYQELAVQILSGEKITEKKMHALIAKVAQSIYEPRIHVDRDVAMPMEDIIEHIDLIEKVPEKLKTLTPREERVLILRFGIGGNRTHTLEEIGKSLNVNRERIRQIEYKALRKMCHPSRSKSFAGLYHDSCDKTLSYYWTTDACESVKAQPYGAKANALNVQKINNVIKKHTALIAETADAIQEAVCRLDLPGTTVDPIPLAKLSVRFDNTVALASSTLCDSLYDIRLSLDELKSLADSIGKPAEEWPSIMMNLKCDVVQDRLRKQTAADLTKMKLLLETYIWSMVRRGLDRDVDRRVIKLVYRNGFTRISGNIKYDRLKVKRTIYLPCINTTHEYAKFINRCISLMPRVNDAMALKLPQLYIHCNDTVNMSNDFRTISDIINAAADRDAVAVVTHVKRLLYRQDEGDSRYYDIPITK